MNITFILCHPFKGQLNCIRNGTYPPCFFEHKFFYDRLNLVQLKSENNFSFVLLDWVTHNMHVKYFQTNLICFQHPRGKILPSWSTLKVMVELKGDKYVL